MNENKIELKLKPIPAEKFFVIPKSPEKSWYFVLNKENNPIKI